jgi:hypothetical protein
MDLSSLIVLMKRNDDLDRILEETNKMIKRIKKSILEFIFEMQKAINFNLVGFFAVR